ncbi:MAG: hypothetical protein AAB604_01980 [Patescibacteria group bacterium]
MASPIIDLKDKRRKWALFPEPVSPPPDQPQPSPIDAPGASMSITEMAWEAPEYLYYPKSPDWYWGVGITAFALMLIAIFTNNLIFAIFAAVAGFTIALWGARKPKTITIKFDGQGMMIESRRYPYQELTSFWIRYEPPFVKEISILTKQTLLPSLRIPLGNENPAEIRAFLLRFLPEKIQEESLIEVLARVVKF